MAKRRARKKNPRLALPALPALSFRARLAIGVGVFGAVAAAVTLWAVSRSQKALTGTGGSATKALFPPSKSGRPPEPTDTWSGWLGTRTGGGINFDRLKDGRNNYRGGMKTTYTNLSPDLFRELKRDYGIERVVTLNADWGGSTVPGLVREAGLESHYYKMHEGNMMSSGKRKAFEEIKALLRQGNTLVHCTHGADRTGAVVGRYYVEDGIMSLSDAIADAKRYGGHKSDSDMMPSST